MARPDAPARYPATAALHAAAPHGQATAQPPNVLGLIIVATAALFATIVTFGVFLPMFGSLGGDGGSSEAAALVDGLPQRLSVCGQDWDRGDKAQAYTSAEVFARDDREPIVVTTGPFPACPPEVDGEVTVVYVRAEPDAFVPYLLVETP